MNETGTPTPRTAKAIELSSDPNGALEVCDLCEQLETELIEARRERDEARRERGELAKYLQQVLTSWDESTWLDEEDFEAFRQLLKHLEKPDAETA